MLVKQCLVKTPSCVSVLRERNQQGSCQVEAAISGTFELPKNYGATIEELLVTLATGLLLPTSPTDSHRDLLKSQAISVKRRQLSIKYNNHRRRHYWRSGNCIFCKWTIWVLCSVYPTNDNDILPGRCTDFAAEGTERWRWYGDQQVKSISVVALNDASVLAHGSPDMAAPRIHDCPE